MKFTKVDKAIGKICEQIQKLVQSSAKETDKIIFS